MRCHRWALDLANEHGREEDGPVSDVTDSEEGIPLSKRKKVEAGSEVRARLESIYVSTRTYKVKVKGWSSRLDRTVQKVFEKHGPTIREMSITASNHLHLAKSLQHDAQPGEACVQSSQMVYSS